MIVDEGRRQEVIDLCRELVRIPSVSGEERAVVEKASACMQSLGYDDVTTDRLGNVRGRIDGRRRGPGVLLDSHLDTVEVANPRLWKHDPFGAEVSSGRIYGRGTSDMKGAAAAMILGAAYFADDCDRDFAGEIHVSCTVHEELFEGVAAREVSRAVDPDVVIVGESTDLGINRGGRGRAEVRVETMGENAHSSNPEAGHNAVYDMARVIEKLRGIEVGEHPLLGRGIMELTDIISSPYPGASVIPDRCRATYDRRLLVGETKESVISSIRRVLETMGGESEPLRVEVECVEDENLCWTGNEIRSRRFFPAWLTPIDHPLVESARDALGGMGLDAVVSCYSFCTNASHYAGEANIPTIGFGPSPEHLAHTVDEYIEIEDLVTTYRGYYRIIEALTRS